MKAYWNEQECVFGRQPDSPHVLLVLFDILGERSAKRSDATCARGLASDFRAPSSVETVTIVLVTRLLVLAFKETMPPSAIGSRGTLVSRIGACLVAFLGARRVCGSA